MLQTDHIWLLKLSPAPRASGKKLIATFSVDGKTKTTLFGSQGSFDFLSHQDRERRRKYVLRHYKDLLTNDPTRPGYLSYYILWGPTTNLEENVNQFTFKLRNNKFSRITQKQVAEFRNEHKINNNNKGENKNKSKSKSNKKEQKKSRKGTMKTKK